MTMDLCTDLNRPPNFCSVIGIGVVGHQCLQENLTINSGYRL